MQWSVKKLGKLEWSLRRDFIVGSARGIHWRRQGKTWKKNERGH